MPAFPVPFFLLGHTIDKFRHTCPPDNGIHCNIFIGNFFLQTIMGKCSALKIGPDIS